MSVSHWTDYHAWPLSPTHMQAARAALPTPDFRALFGVLYFDPRDHVTQLAPREAIENAAMAMHPEQACPWLESVYALAPGTGDRLLAAILQVRGRAPARHET